MTQSHSVDPKKDSAGAHSPHARFISVRDIQWVVMVPMLMFFALVIPERFWAPITRAVASLGIWKPNWRTRSHRERIRRILGANCDEHTTRDLMVRSIARTYETRLQCFREYRPDSWQPNIRIFGKENIKVALARGSGALLWVSPFASHMLVAKKALNEAGFDVSHLSESVHGFSDTQFGMRFLNPIWTKIEDRYLGERVLLGSDSSSALRVLQQRLRENRIISITVFDTARRTVDIPFLTGWLRIPTSPIHLARTANAPILPVFPIRNTLGTYEVHVEPSLKVTIDADYYEAIARDYVHRLEPYVLEYPDQWLGNLRLG
jgi:lauroyl/myristoyl acyltransferase